MNAIELKELEQWQVSLEQESLNRSSSTIFGPRGAATDHTRDCERKAMLLGKLLKEISGKALPSKPSASVLFEVNSSGEIEAGLRPFNDSVTVSCESGQWGGAPGEFEEYMKDCLSEWYDASVRVK